MLVISIYHRVIPELEIMTVIHHSTTKCIIVNEHATAIFVGGASLLHLPPKFSVTFMFTLTGTVLGNSALVNKIRLFDTKIEN